MGVAATMAVLLAACGGPTPRATDPTTVPRATTTTAGDGLAVAPYDWQRLAAPSLDLGGGPSDTLSALVAPAVPGGAWLAAGTVTAADGSTRATAWTSPDARTWTAEPLGPATTDSEATAAASWGDRTVVVGSVGHGAGRRAEVWLSEAPGLRFTPVTGQVALTATDGRSTAGGAATSGSAPDAGGATFNRVAAGALGVFASGTVDGSLALWYSTDGRHWTRLLDAESVIRSKSHAAIDSLLVTSRGVLAAGTVADGDDPADTDGAIWASTNGIGWRKVTSADPSFTGDGDHAIAGLVSAESTVAPQAPITAVGSVRAASTWAPASWISPDGFSWSQASLDLTTSEDVPSAGAAPLGADPQGGTAGTGDLLSDGGAAGARVTAVTATPTGFLAVGGGPGGQSLWSSPDGLAWTAVPLPPAAAADPTWHADLVASNGTTTVVADDTAGRPRMLVRSPAGWHEVTADPADFGVPRPTATPTRLTSAGGRLFLTVDIDDPGQVLGDDRSSAAVLSSTDGVTWTAGTGDGVFTGRAVTDLVGVASGVVAVGGTSGTPGTGVPAARLWSSPDGTTWTPIVLSGAGADARAGARDGGLTAVVGQGPAAPGTPSDTAVGWVSTDGVTWSAVGPLDPSPGLNAEVPLGMCAGPDGLVAVGTASQGPPGRQAVTWASPDGRRWTPGTVSPAAVSGGVAEMRGCLSTGNGYLAYGQTTTVDGSTEPALWDSDAGVAWTERTVSAFTGSPLGPLTGLAVRGTTWLSVGGADTTSADTAPGGNLGLWRSLDAGTTWERLDTTGAPWPDLGTATVRQVGFAGNDAVVAGTADGRLAIWLGVPTGP